ncbi:hypothetical protein Tco_0058437 [Tanacetum coccineum]
MDTPRQRADVKCVLTQKALDAFCNKFHIPEEVHPVLPNQNDTMHERPTGKIRLYTRFFNFSIFSLPLSNFLVDVLRHFYINISQLFVIEATKVSYFEIVDDFACPTSFPWHTAKHVIRDPAPVAAKFNEQDYATLVAHPSPFRKFPEAFLCLVGLSHHYTLDEETYPRFLQKNGEEMDIFAFIHTSDPTKVRIIEQERNEGEPWLLDSTIGRTVLLLLVAPDHAKSKLEASVERLFDEGGSGNQTEQGDSVGGRKDADIQPVIKVADTVVENVDPMQPKRQGKIKYVIVGVGEASHPPKSTIKRFLADFMAGLNLRAIRAPPSCSLVKSSVPIMTIVTTITSTVDPASVAKEKLVKPSLFCTDSSSAGGTDPTAGVFSNLTGSDFLVGAIHTIVDPDTDLQKIYMVDEFAPPKFFASIRGMEHDQLFTEFNVGTARQMSLSAEGELMKVRKGEIENLKAQLLLRETEAAEAIRLSVEYSNFEAVEKSLRDETNALKERNAILKKERDALDVKMALHLEEKFYPYLLTTVSGRRWLLTHVMELAIVKCLNSPEYLSALGAAISKVLTDVAAHNPFVEVDYTSALKQLRGLNELQPNVDQLMVSIHRSSDKVVLGATALTLALDVSSTKGISDIVSTTTNTNTALSTTFDYASFIAPISVDDYEVIGANDQAVADGNAASFPNVDDAELNIPSDLFTVSRGSCFPSRSLNLYASFPSASVTSYGPSHLGPSFPVSSTRLASLLQYTRSTFAILSVGMPIFAGMTASVPYVNEDGVSPLLDFIMAIGLRMFNRSKVLADTLFLAPIFKWIVP